MLRTCIFVLLFVAFAVGSTNAQTRVFPWPKHAPGETSLEEGTNLPAQKHEVPTVTRTVRVRRPSLDVFLSPEPNGTAVLVLPGGGFEKVVPDKEGNETAPWLNGLGISVFVLRYRTNEITPSTEPAWRRPLQDAQRSLCLIRANAEEWHVNPDQLGVIGFSAGGQVAAILHTAKGGAEYEAIDDIDKNRNQPNFSLLIYPWNVLNTETQQLLPQIQISPESAPAFLVHTHDDRSSSVGSALIYAALRRNNVPAELHIYENGGHGYGMRQIAGSQIGSWPDRATAWLQLRGLTRN